MYIVDIILDNANKALQKTYSYEVDKNQFEQLVFSSVVKVNFNHQIVIGFVIDKYQVDEVRFKLKKIIAVIEYNLITTSQMKLVEFMKMNYVCSYYEILNLIIPKKVRRSIRAFDGTDEIDIKMQLGYKINKSDYPLTKRQKEVVNLIANGYNTKFEIKEYLQVSDSVLNKLLEYDVLTKIKLPFDYLVPFNLIDQEDVLLTVIQQRCLDEIKMTNKPFLIHGVTGSGKTEIYIKLIHQTIDNQKQALFLVPETTLTTIFASRLKNIFGPKIAYINAQTNDQQMYNYYQKIKSGVIDIVIGTRSSIFMPFSNLGLIIIDEEHDLAYKNRHSVFYHVFDIAKYYYDAYGTKIVMGSATPKLETYARCQKGIYGYFNLYQRYNKINMPYIEISKVENHDTIFTPDTLMQIKARIDNGEKVVVLFNKKGHSKQVECSNCNYVFLCPNCNVGLTYYKSLNQLACSCCGLKKVLPKMCPKCQETYFKFLGVAIEQVYEHLERYFKGKVVLLDSDLAKKKRYLQEVMQRLYSDESFILLGTQIITKGLDIANVNLVVVPNVDNALFFNDLKARERLFQLLVQVSGRAGRQSGLGHVIIQTMYPNYSLFNQVSTNDYAKFYQREMKVRKHYNSIPYYNICQIKAKHKNEQIVVNFLNNLKNKMAYTKDEYICMQVTKPYISKEFDKFIYFTQIKYKKANLAADLKPFYQMAILEGIDLEIDLQIEDNIV